MLKEYLELKMNFKKGDSLIELSEHLYSFFVKVKEKKNEIARFKIAFDDSDISDNDDTKIMFLIEKNENVITKRFFIDSVLSQNYNNGIPLLILKYTDSKIIEKIIELNKKLDQDKYITASEISEFGNLFIYCLICCKDKEKKIESVFEFIIKNI